LRPVADRRPPCPRTPTSLDADSALLAAAVSGLFPAPSRIIPPPINRLPSTRTADGRKCARSARQIERASRHRTAPYKR